MPNKRFIDTREQSFFGNYIYDLTVPKDHFLRLLNQLIPWDHFTNRLLELYAGGAEYGRPPFNPVQMLKICLLAHFYDLSDRDTEMYVNENIPAKYLLVWDWIKKHPITPQCQFSKHGSPSKRTWKYLSCY